MWIDFLLKLFPSINTQKSSLNNESGFATKKKKKYNIISQRKDKEQCWAKFFHYQQKDWNYNYRKHEINISIMLKIATHKKKKKGAEEDTIACNNQRPRLNPEEY